MRTTLLQVSLLASLAAATKQCSTPSSTVAKAWYAGWHSEDFPLSKVSWDKYTQMTYSFAETTPDVNTLSFEGSSPDLVPEFVQTAWMNGVTPTVSIGGWTGSRFFSSAVATAENRTAFVKTVIDLAKNYTFGGLDFDWEYPGSQGLGCNTISPNDTSNFLLFLQELRQDPLGSKLILSAATSISPFASADGTPSTNVSEFAAIFDHITIMNYDIWGSWSTAVGPNAPLDDSCAEPDNQQGSAVSAVKAWTEAGFPVNKILLGVASYGHSFTVTKENALGNGTKIKAYPEFDADRPPTGDAWDDGAGVDACGVETGPGGNWDFWGLVKGGFLNENGTAADGIYYRFDKCGKTPYVYNETAELMVSYDDAVSFGVKGQFIRNNQLGGFAMWEAGGDYNDILLDSITKSVAGNA